MQNNELTDIENAMQDLVRRAYELGRNDVLARVVGVLKTDQPATEPLALTGPRHDGSVSSDASLPKEQDATQVRDVVVASRKETSSADSPWWARPPR